MERKTDYLLKYVSNETYKKVLNKNHAYTIENLEDSRIDVDLNIRHLIQYGVKNIDGVVLNRLDDLLMPHLKFMKKITEDEDRFTKSGLIDMLENS